jgi:hypothetical protein
MEDGRAVPTRPRYFFLLPFSFSLSPFSPLFSFLSRHREGDEERMADGVQGYRGAQG